MTRTRHTALPALLLAIAACRDDMPTAPDFSLPGQGPALAISDAVHQAGVPQFYWLPPTVPNPGPAVTGTFDGDLLGGPGAYPQLEVRICPAGVTTLCPAGGTGSFKTFNGYATTPAITMDQAAGNYQLLWNKSELGAGQSPYRAWVLVRTGPNANPLALGFADVKVVANNKALKQVDPTQFVGLVAGNPLYLKFTVRTGIAGAVSVALGSSTLVAGGATTATATVTDLHGGPLANLPVSWGVTPLNSPPGSVSPTTSTTGVAGTATTTLTAGNTDGSGTVTATVGAAPGQLTGSASFTVGSLVAQSLVAGGAHTCGLTGTGAAYCWGYNFGGQLGDDTNIDRHAPVPVILPDGVTGFASLTAGSGHTCALTSTGAAYCWGANGFGEVGDGSGILFRRVPVAVSLPGGVSGFASLTAGSWHTCGLTSTGAAYCWGWNEHGQLGDNSTDNSPVPVPVSLPNGVSAFASIEAGERHTCALTSTGAAYCWGKNASGQLGNNSQTDSPIPVAVSLPFGVTGFTSLTAEDHTCALTSAGDAYCWGANAGGQLGNNQTVYSPVPDAVVLPDGVTGFASLTAGGLHTCGLANTGAAYCWGANNSGELGNNSLVPEVTPVAVELPSGVTEFASLTVGGAHSCGLTASGGAYCWGWNFRGQVGDGTTTDRLVPTPVSGF